VILDTSAAIELLNRKDKQILHTIEKEKPTEIFICGVTRFELGVGSEDDAQILDIPCLSMNCEMFGFAAKMYSLLKQHGKMPGIKDCFIAACAITEDSLLLTYNKDFEVFKEFGLNAKVLKKMQ